MKKILIIINTIILSFTLFSCNRNKDEILYQDEILDLVYSSYFTNADDFLSYEVFDRAYRGKNNLNILSRYYVDLENDNFYEANITEKKVIAGYCNNDTINKLQNECMKYGNLYDDYEYKMLYCGYSSIYYMFNYLNNVSDNFDILKLKTHIYEFYDGIPLEYNNMMLNFVFNYYKIKLHTGREIVAVGLCFGEITDNVFYPYVINFSYYDPINYGNFIYFEKENKNVVDYYKFRNYILVEDYDIECIPEKLYGEFEGDEVELFNYFKPALSDDTPNKEFEDGCSYKYDYDKLKDLLVK